MLISQFDNPQELRSVTTMLTCLDCEGSYQKLQSRGLCATCYKRHQRAETLDDFPTTDFWVNRENYIRWAVQHFPEQVQAALDSADSADSATA